MVFLLLASIAGVGYAIERLVNLRTGSVVPPGLAERADELWRAGKWDEIEDLPAKSDSTLARVLAVIAKHRHSSLADVSVMASDVASRDLRRHLQRAFPLAVVATVSPLLGLFGTVIGMIGAFDKVAVAGSLGDASLLGGDISKALITTAAGLTIAIPTLVLYHYSKNKTNMLGLMLEEEVGELLGAWHAAPADRSQSEAEVRDAGKA
jgi:biopolymer transport protein ExbB